MQRAFRTLARLAGLLVVALSAAVVFTSASADPALWPAKPETQTTQVVLVSNGFHAGIVIPREALARKRTKLIAQPLSL